MLRALKNLRPRAHLFTAIFILIVSLFLRIFLGYLNFGANDSHLDVSRFILTEKRLPSRDDCWSCYQPKLYHITTAILLAVRSPETERDAIREMQLPNALLGMLLLVLLWKFLLSGPWAEKTKLLTFALVALNPKLIGIFSQATNDAYVIFFSTAALYCTHRFLLSGQKKDLVGLTISTVLAGLSKASGVVIAFGVALIFIMKIFFQRERPFGPPSKKYLHALSVFLISFLLIVPIGGQYWQNFQTRGNPLIPTFSPMPRPGLFKTTPFSHQDGQFRIGCRPGINSVMDGYFTFRFLEMIKNPRLTNTGEDYPKHRTSFWSQIYGRTHDVFYDNWPPSWQMNTPFSIFLSRGIFILALFPTFLLGTTVLQRAQFWIKNLWLKRWDVLTTGADWIFDIFLSLILFNALLYSYLYRDFSCIKAIFIFPALLAATFFLAQGIETIYRKFNRTKLTPLIDALLIFLLAFYISDIGLLILHLLRPEMLSAYCT